MVIEERTVRHVFKRVLEKAALRRFIFRTCAIPCEGIGDGCTIAVAVDGGKAETVDILTLSEALAESDVWTKNNAR